ncbi:MAG: PorT family protein [Bernardetiaceae bacterium]|jgi:hypothetical protein|nr:PorT family protein [Bernardetiaceae bacterium]
MKRNLLFAFLFIISSSAFAQVDFDLGVKAGAGISQLNVRNVQLNNLGQAVENVVPGDARVSFQVGGFARLRIKSLFIQPELYYTSIGSQAIFQSGSLSQAQEFSRNFNLNRFDVPVLVGLQLGERFRIGAGPVFSALASRSTSINEKVNSSTLGFQAGAGLDLGKLNIDFRYEMPISRYSDGLNVGNLNFPADQRIRQFMLTVGYEIF